MAEFNRKIYLDLHETWNLRVFRVANFESEVKFQNGRSNMAEFNRKIYLDLHESRNQEVFRVANFESEVKF